METTDQEIRLLELDIEIELKRTEISMKEEEDPTDCWEDFCEYMQPEWDALAELDREKRMLMIPEFDELPTNGDVMSLNDFIEAVKNGWFIDYDGFGNYVRDGKETNIMVFPSDVEHKSLRKDFDTIIWYNR